MNIEILRIKKEIISFLAFRCNLPNHHCVHLKSCSYFDELFTKGVDALTVGNELRNLFCGYDGWDILVIYLHFSIKNSQKQNYSARFYRFVAQVPAHRNHK